MLGFFIIPVRLTGARRILQAAQAVSGKARSPLALTVAVRRVSRCAIASVGWPATADTVQVEGRHFRVILPPMTSVRLTCGMSRFAKNPSYAFHWHGGAVPIE